jgi:hypothetical protein
MEIESEVGVGTAVHIYLPGLDPSASEPTSVDASIMITTDASSALGRSCSATPGA